MSTFNNGELISHFGMCPKCAKECEILNVERSHFGVCREHKLFWEIGWNLLSSWEDETPEIWRKNSSFLAQCRESKSLHFKHEVLRSRFKLIEGRSI
jgi:hypothetical protein